MANITLDLPPDLHQWLSRVADGSGLEIETCCLVHLTAERIRAQDREYSATASRILALTVDDHRIEPIPDGLPSYSEITIDDLIGGGE